MTRLKHVNAYENRDLKMWITWKVVTTHGWKMTLLWRNLKHKTNYSCCYSPVVQLFFCLMCIVTIVWWIS
jgi:hypothetical protein